MFYFFENIYTIFYVYVSYFYFNKIKYIDYKIEEDTDSDSDNEDNNYNKLYRMMYNFTYHKLQTYE